MDTRKLGLLLFAYLRGLLKSGYPNGFRSILRENMVLSALEREATLETREKILALRASFSSHYEPKSVQTTVANYISRMESMLSLSLFRTPEEEERDMSSVDAMCELYHALADAGILTKPKPHGIS